MSILQNPYVIQFYDGSYLKSGVYQGVVYDENYQIRHNKTFDINEAAMFSSEGSANIALDMLDITNSYQLVEYEIY